MKAIHTPAGAELTIKARAALDELAEHGVDLLITEGCAGERRSADRCPVSKYLRKRTGADFSVGGTAAVSFKDAGGFATYIAASVVLPNEVAQIVHDFDRGAYPELAKPRLERLR